MAGEPAIDAELVRLARELGTHPVAFALVLVAVVCVGYGVAFGAAIVARGRAVGAVRWAAARWNALARTAPMTALAERVPAVFRAMRWLTSVEYVVLHLALGFVLLACIAGFVAIADAVGEGRTLVQVDLAFAESLHASASPGTVAIMRRFTDLGDFGGLTALSLVGVVLLVRSRRHVLAMGWALSMVGCAILNHGLKAWFVRARPRFADPYVLATGWSFPSGHSMGTFVLAGMATFVAFHFVRTPARRLVVAVVATAWTVVMGYSRMLLGAHYLTDVVAGFCAGAAWLSTCVSALVIAESRGRVAATRTADPVPPAA